MMELDTVKIFDRFKNDIVFSAWLYKNKERKDVCDAIEKFFFAKDSFHPRAIGDCVGMLHELMEEFDEESEEERGDLSPFIKEIEEFKKQGSEPKP